VLDTAMVEHGRSYRDALTATVELARRVEELGYRRFWVAEHHGSRSSASPAPAVLVAEIAARTSRMSVGSGGVMLTNHAPLAVAEQFATLDALHPGRIDLGVGRGSGTKDAVLVSALRRGAPPADSEEYARSVGELLDFADVGGPGVWLLSSSGQGARLAAKWGLPLVVAHHIRPDRTKESVALYRSGFRPSRTLDRPYLMVALTAICADTNERAEFLSRPAVKYFADVVSGGQDPAAFHTPLEMAGRDLTDTELATADRLVRTQAIGDASRTLRRLVDIADATAADELMLMTPVFDIGDRVRSFELVMSAAAPHVGTSCHGRPDATGRRAPQNPLAVRCRPLDRS
jgi:luciferase family oxidoreductase group 1